VRWDGRAKTLEDARLTRWRAEGRLVPICPECLGGLPVPRPAAEIETGATAADVASGRGRILTGSGADQTDPFLAGAERAVEIARTSDCRFALLTDGSPSCGSTRVNDGRFEGRKIDGEGIAAHLLREAGVEVFAPSSLDRLAARIEALETSERAATLSDDAPSEPDPLQIQRLD